MKIGSMKKQKRSQFIKETKSSFRSENDYDEKRSGPVPSADVLEANLDELKLKWEGNLPGVTISAIEKAKEHLKCVEGQSAGTGTNKNETLHAILNSLFQRFKKVSPETALKIITMRLLLYNRKILSREEPLFVPSGMVSGDKDDASRGSSFGLSETTRESFFPPAETPSFFEVSDEAPISDEECEAMKSSILTYKEVLSYFNFEDIAFKPLDIVFNSPLHCETSKLKQKTRKESEFKRFLLRLQIKIDNGPFDGVRETLLHEGLSLRRRTKSWQELSDETGRVLLVVQNDLNNPIVSLLPKCIR